MFQLTPHPLETINLKENLVSESAGGFCSFEGWVRNQSADREVLFLEYEAFDKLCESQAQEIFCEAYAKFDILQAKGFHRVGKLKLGEMAVWVGVTAVHRDAAFKACRYIIDEIKQRLPIWKKEFYANGDSGWVNCGRLPPANSDANQVKI
ncbi:MAG: hypothetical protein A2787_02950 [Omnitrophica WOR_2 bacterium RIFCSPHIGHO2_01_FULL_48_9]|nr:MAG: hypothetical protein A3D10_00715 [Omnitrophica WOR_2 bacterium RIFCSPHIGHO2_02_FULL_48_11]OGX33715.1 MAG: hypothetical protein A2787_02950 [Omnitrophica WOR_2 bacterium RIFCSPHIGHO2_01_FULL_48_9]